MSARSCAGNCATGSLPAPRGLWVAQNSPRGLTIVWNGVAGAKGFRLYQVSGNAPERLLGNLAPNVGSFVVIVRNEMLSVPQRFSIETVDAAGRPSARAAFNVVTPIDPGPALGPVPGPASVRVAEGQGGIVVTWPMKVARHQSELSRRSLSGEGRPRNYEGLRGFRCAPESRGMCDGTRAVAP